MLELALCWDDVQKAAQVQNTCIAVANMSNHDRARQDWERLPGVVEYWLSRNHDTYSRVVRYTQLWQVKPLWMLDFCKPFSLGHVEMVVEVLEGWLLVAKTSLFYNQKIETGTISLALPALPAPEGLTYLAHPAYMQEWVLLEGQGKAAPGARPLVEPVYDD